MKKYILFVLTFSTLACSRYPADVRQALKLAGDNRAELEKVLEHYSKLPEDTLKLQSAYFLIANMPYHYTIHDARIDSFKTYISEIEPQEGVWATFVKEIYGHLRETIQIKPDLYYITSDYLIRNIDFSFQIWQEMPWCKNYSFDTFCEEILPYRICNEPLEYWKEEYYAAFRSIIDTMEHDNNPEVIYLKLLTHISEQSWIYLHEMNSVGFGSSIILQKRIGTCKEQAEFITYILRTLGIPSGIDFYLQDPIYHTSSHFWNYARNKEGKHFTFDYYDSFYLANRRSQARKLGKVYRNSYALQKESLPVKYKNSYIPSGKFANVFLQDVSGDYFPDTHLTVHPEQPGLFKQGNLAYLCTFNQLEGWVPITWSKPRKGVVRFEHIEPNLLYQLRLIDKTQNIAVTKPFILRSNETPQFLNADMTHVQTMTLYRKFRLPFESPYYARRSVGGKFQVANKQDFSDSVTIHTIQKVADMSYEIIKPDNIGKFKYIRYLSSNGGYNNMAELQLFSNGKRLRGKEIGTEGARDEFPNSEKNSVFDDDPLSFFDALEADGSWAGLAFDKPYHIDEIRYIFRNDDNNIRPGDKYELFYISNGEWLSAGRQTADTTLLIYEKVPANTLYWLRNLTRGKQERPFTYENDKQIWW